MFDFFMGDPERKRQLQELYHAHGAKAGKVGKTSTSPRSGASKFDKPMPGSPRKFKSTSTGEGKGVMGPDTGETNEGTDDEVARAFGFHKRPPRTEPVQIYITQPMMQTPPEILYNIRNGIFEDVAKREEEEWKPKKLAEVGQFFAPSIARATRGRGRGRGGASASVGTGRGRGRPPKLSRPESPPPPPPMQREDEDEEEEANFPPPFLPPQSMMMRPQTMPFRGLSQYGQEMTPDQDEFLRMFAPPTSPRSARRVRGGRGRGRPF